jgi:hypothetical protein
LISLEICPGLWWRVVDTADLPQDGQRLIRELEKRFVYELAVWIESDFDRIKKDLRKQWRDACCEVLSYGMLPLNWKWNLQLIETTDKHFIRDDDKKLRAMIEGIYGEPHDWEKIAREKLTAGAPVPKNHGSWWQRVLKSTRQYLLWEFDK